MDELYAPVGTAAAATGHRTVTVTVGNVLAFVKPHTTVRLNSGGANCTAGYLYNVKRVDLIARTFELTTAFAGATNTATHVCVQPFPGKCSKRRAAVIILGMVFIRSFFLSSLKA